MMYISYQLDSQKCHINNMKFTVVDVLVPQKTVDTANQGL